FGIELASHVIALGEISIADNEIELDSIKAIYDNDVLRCVDQDIEQQMVARVDEASKAGDTLGGIFEVVAKGCPPGLGSHTSWATKHDGQLAQAVMSIHAVKAVELGEGVANA